MTKIGKAKQINLILTRRKAEILIKVQSGMVLHIYNTNSQEVDAREL